MCGRRQEYPPKQEIDGAKVLGMYLVVKVVGNGDHGNRAEKRRRVACVEDDIELPAHDCYHEKRLFVNYASWPKRRMDPLRAVNEVALIWNDAGFRLIIAKYEVLIHVVEFGESQ